MHMVHEMQRLRAEHAALATLSGFLLDLVAAPQPPRPTELASVRGMLRDTLVRHLKCEDWALYPRLKMSGDPELARLAGNFVCEMGHVADAFRAYDSAWTPERAATDWAGFCDETQAILGTIGARIEREDRDLYPAADELALRRRRAAQARANRGAARAAR